MIEQVRSTRFTGQFENLQYVAAAKATLTIGAYDAAYQVCQIGFNKRDGSILVSFPYLRAQSGLLSVAQFPEDQSGPITLALGSQARITSHLAKYSHHPDGAVLFSQDGKIRSEVRRKSFRLDGPIGRLFYMSVYWPSGFARFDEAQRRPGRAYLRTRFTDCLPSAVMVRAEWRRKRGIVANIQPQGAMVGPISKVHSRITSGDSVVHFLAPPTGFPLQGHVLLVSAEPTRALPTIPDPSLIFLGGFDPHERAEAEHKVHQTGCMVAMYPSSNESEFARTLQSVDFNPDSASRPAT